MKTEIERLEDIAFSNVLAAVQEFGRTVRMQGLDSKKGTAILCRALIDAAATNLAICADYASAPTDVVLQRMNEKFREVFDATRAANAKDPKFNR